MKSLVWFRRDLRIDDNTALFHACDRSTQGVVAAFAVTPVQWKEHDDAPCKVMFWLQNLEHLSKALKQLNIPLLVINVPSYAELPNALIDCANQHQCQAIYFNREYEPNERSRDANVESIAARHDIEVCSYHDRTIVAPDAIQTREGRYYSVFTPYRKSWDTLVANSVHLNPTPRKQPKQDVEPSVIPGHLDGFDFSDYRKDLWPAGEFQAHRILEKFTAKLSNYDSARDIPSVSGTSLLSPYLAAGVVSPRQCLAAALAACQGNLHGCAGGERWVSELTWRDFYSHVLDGFPRVGKHQPFQLKTKHIPWRTNLDEFERWKRGQTGYPIVDAGMRQLSRTGWMHNRLRMITAMFLTKHLMIDWRMGEKHFMRTLIDGDLAANNGGWQWSASTGTDAAPYFRIFNPFRQSQRFDPDGSFIRRFCPELKPVPDKALHDPKKLETAISQLGVSYPSCIVDHSFARRRALDIFKDARNGTTDAPATDENLSHHV